MVRVSKERDGMISPENQRYAIEQYAARENIDVIAWIEGIDESGSRKKSAWWARLDSGIEHIESKRADVLLVWRIDRTARNRLRWAIATDRIETAGGYIESATEPNDRSPAGRFGRGMMAEHAAFMAESIGATWKETQERRVRHGLTPNGQHHYGYTYSRENGYEIDPIEGPILADMYRSYAAGESAQSIAARLTDPDAKPDENGVYSRYARWNTPAVLRVLDSGFGAGLVLFRSELHAGAHPPVITEDDWARFKSARADRRRRPRAERSPYTYSGLMECHCGAKMHGRTDHGDRRYACLKSKHYGVHPDASLSEKVVEAAVMQWLGKLRDEIDAEAKAAPRAPRIVDDPAGAIARRIAAVNERLDSATAKFVDGLIPRDAYDRLRAKCEQERRDLEAELTRVSAQATVRPIAFAGDLVGRWPEIPVEQRRQAVRMLVDRIRVQPRDAPKRVVIDSPFSRT
ncbi:recombinase family protein [Microbacterium sp. IEGM 1404]|uniref:recombinase family protein n=1 Tax=Microbacterium sp. IEGM 1404 TaxID=3047084 RepID=UPI0024B6B38D|nr:recombinase family protein [Microbacterium sp. IEGM 1404]MDI9889925.1 recombinase family protein [Microbacterium sp. IEGM 1404]